MTAVTLDDNLNTDVGILGNSVNPLVIWCFSEMLVHMFASISVTPSVLPGMSFVVVGCWEKNKSRFDS